MSQKTTDDQYSDEETARRRDDVIKRITTGSPAFIEEVLKGAIEPVSAPPKRK